MAYNGQPVLDVHGHVTVPAAANYFLVQLQGTNSPKKSPIGKSLATGQVGKGSLSVDDFRAAADQHVAYIDERNIDVQVVGPRPYLQMGWMEPHLHESWARYVNDMIAQQVSFHPDRFVGAAQLPVDSTAPDAAHCVPELNRAVEELGFVATYLSPDASGNRTTPGLGDPWWNPLFSRVEELNVPVIVHGTNALDPRYRDVPNNYQLHFLTEQYLAGQFLGHSDTFDRFPDLRVIICHCGGALNRFVASDPHLPQRDLSANLFYDSCGYDLNFLEAAIKQRGVPQMLFGTEAPGSGGTVRKDTGRTSDDLVPVLDSFGFLSADDRLDILYRNPLRVVPGLAKAGRLAKSLAE